MFSLPLLRCDVLQNWLQFSVDVDMNVFLGVVLGGGGCFWMPKWGFEPESAPAVVRSNVSCDIELAVAGCG